MTVEWHYSREGQQFGPVSAAEIKELSAAGQIGPDDLVWNSSLPDWVPASRVKGLMFSAADVAQAAVNIPQPTTPTPQDASPPPLAYQSADISQPIQMTTRAVDLLSRTRTWVLIVALAMFFEALLIIVRSFGQLVMFANPSGQGSAILITYSLVTLAVGLFLGAPTVFLFRYYTHIGNLRRLRRPVDLENALNAQRAYWKFLAITTLVLIGVIVVTVTIAMAGGAAGWF